MQRNSGNGTYAGGYKFAELEHMLGGPVYLLGRGRQEEYHFFYGEHVIDLKEKILATPGTMPSVAKCVACQRYARCTLNC